MATSAEFHAYVMEQLARVGRFTSRNMMGEYVIYYADSGKLPAMLCDDLFLLKPTPAVLELMPDADRAYPYEGSKTLMVVVDRIEDTDLLGAVLTRMEAELPEPKAKAAKKTAGQSRENGEKAASAVAKLTGPYVFVTLKERPELADAAATWFSSKWKVPREAYAACMDDYLNGATPLGWYLCLKGKRIVGGLGVIENDFHNRPDLTPNICAVFTEPAHRCKGIAGTLLALAVDDLRAQGISPVYLVTDHVGFYERYGWEYLCQVQCDGEEDTSRMYVRR